MAEHQEKNVMRTGVLLSNDTSPAADLAAFARAAERAGIAVWVPELYGRDPFVLAGMLLSATSTLVVGTGIANVYARDAMATRAAALTLTDLYGERFELGLGVSNPLVNEQRGHSWQPPVAMLKRYLDAFDGAPLALRSPVPPIFIAAHGPRLLALARARTDGANLYLTTRDHVRSVREALGSGKRLNVVLQAYVCEEPTVARRRARKALALYRSLPNYHRAWRAMGLTDADFSEEASDRFIDELFAWGDGRAIQARIEEFLAAGADRVMLIAHNLDPAGMPDLDLIEAIAVH
jgi:probable F420-dependent oxidoreductase